MPRDNAADIQRINSLRKAYKDAETKTAELRIHRKQAEGDLGQVCESIREMGHDPGNIEAFEAWIEKEAGDIAALIERADIHLERAQESIDG